MTQRLALGLILLTAGTANIARGNEDDLRYVAASVANVRASPEAIAPLVTKLPIGQSVLVLETRADWLKSKLAP